VKRSTQRSASSQSRCRPPPPPPPPPRAALARYACFAIGSACCDSRRALNPGLRLPSPGYWRIVGGLRKTGDGRLRLLLSDVYLFCRHGRHLRGGDPAASAERRIT